MHIAAVHESENGTKQTFRGSSRMSAFGREADMASKCHFVCSWPWLC